MDQVKDIIDTDKPLVLDEMTRSFYKDELTRLLPDNLNLYTCLTCSACSNGCPATGAPGFEGWDVRKMLRLLVMGQLKEVVDSNFPWICTGCGRCTLVCPMGLDIVPVIAQIKSMRKRENVPGILHKGVEKALDSGNNMAISPEDYFSTLADVGNELAEEECPGFYVPIDKKDASILFFPNSKEIYGDFEDMKWWWKIFYAARENWTVPSKNWEAVDWGLFTGNFKATATLAQRKMDLMRELRIKQMIMPDCGGGSYGCRSGMKICQLDDPENVVDFVYLYEYLQNLFKTGRIQVDKSINAGKRFTWHDSCKHGRELEKHFGKGFYDEPRWILNQCVDDFVDMIPNREGNFCCGAGGGNWPMPYEAQSAHHGRFKYDQIKRSGADVVVVGCSNCRDQMMRRIPKYFKDYKYEVKYIWQLVAESLVIKPWTEEEIARGQAQAAAQWEALGVDLDAAL
jgi:Fe-S oxidoreductase